MSLPLAANIILWFLFFILVVLPFGYLIYSIVVYRLIRVPFVATPKKYLTKIVSILGHELAEKKDLVIYDLGCGTGDFIWAFEEIYGDKIKRIVGVEFSPLLIFYAKIKAHFKKSTAIFLQQDFFNVNLSNADLIYLFLVPTVLEQVWQKIIKEGKSGLLVGVLSSPIPKVDYEKAVELKIANQVASRLYLYRL